MFVAIKDNKIIAYNETGDFPCLVCDEIKEINDVTLVQFEGEFLPDNEAQKILAQLGWWVSYLIQVAIYIKREISNKKSWAFLSFKFLCRK